MGEAPDVAGSVTLYRWWTDACPYCEASLPELEDFRRRYAPRGLSVVGVYHPKPPRDVDDADIVAAAQRLGFAGPVAVDRDWSKLEEVWDGERSATSMSFLYDLDGALVWTHPGPVLTADDIAELERVVDPLLVP